MLLEFDPGVYRFKNTGDKRWVRFPTMSFLNMSTGLKETVSFCFGASGAVFRKVKLTEEDE
jgi:hypothetical protein